jgi:hypothetical protein
MNAALAYAIIAVLVVILAGVLVRQRQKDDGLALDAARDRPWDLLDASGMRVAERIFDSSDYFWLRDEIRHPQLARALLLSRRQMAVRWLKSLRRSFDDFVASPDSLFDSDAGLPDQPDGRRLLWLTIRFHLLLAYALLVVRLFGPYHTLIPSFRWINLLPGVSPSRAPRSVRDVSRLL